MKYLQRNITLSQMCEVIDNNAVDHNVIFSIMDEIDLSRPDLPPLGYDKIEIDIEDINA